MWPFVQPKPRPSLRLAVQLGAGLLVPLWGAPALAQGVAVITPSSAMAPREEREKLAPLVMAPAAAEAMRAEATANQLAWRESLKRMSEAEADDPSRALAAYKRFFVERTMSPELGVEVGLKIAQLRSKLGDSQGALQTCEVLRAKYADEPTAALLALQKARVLMESKQLVEASQCVNEAMPELVALGPSRYREISDVLLQLVQANLDNGNPEGRERARGLCVGVEEIYLRWTKKDAVDHLWQRFEVLQTKYEEAGAQKRANELLPKVSDALLKVPVKPGYVEGAVLSLEAARYFAGQGQLTQAMLFYIRTPQFGDEWHTVLANYEQAQILISEKRYREARALIEQPTARVGQAKVLLLSASGQLHYAEGKWLEAKKDSEGVISSFNALESSQQQSSLGAIVNTAQARLMMSQNWLKQPLSVERNEIRVKTQRSGKTQPPILEKVYVRSPEDASLQVSVNNDQIKAYLSDVKTDKSVNSYYFQQEVIVEIPANTVSDVNAQLTIKSVSPAEATIKLPIFVEAENPIQLSVASLFFGTVSAKQPVARLLSLSSPVPFRVLKVESDNTAVKIKMEEPKTSKEQTLQVTLVPLQADQFYTGTLLVTTDMVGQEVIEVPYAAQSK